MVLTNTIMPNLFLMSPYLSNLPMNKLQNIELYYTTSPLKGDNLILTEHDEINHILKVMRHRPGDEIYITDGKGRIYKTSVRSISAEILQAEVLQEYKYENNNKNLIFCIPRLRSAERFETALEKCTELGITSFIIFDSARTIRKGNKTTRWQKILVSAMKQSLRSFLPELKVPGSLEEIAAVEGNKILFVQEAENAFNMDAVNRNDKTYFVFGPEGDFTEDEKKLFSTADFFNLGENRLRSETAVIKCASILS